MKAKFAIFISIQERHLFYCKGDLELSIVWWALDSGGRYNNIYRRKDGPSIFSYRFITGTTECDNSFRAVIKRSL